MLCKAKHKNKQATLRSPPSLLYLGFFVSGMLTFKFAILIQFQLFLGIAAILCGGIILALALGALKRN